MSTLAVFETISLDGYFTNASNDMSWAHEGSDDPEFAAFTSRNASGGGTLLFGRVTYEMMASFWPTPAAAQMMPEVARGMNAMKKYVASRTLKSADWSNTTIVPDLVDGVRKLKDRDDHITILGSGSIVPPLANAGLIDEYQFVISPIALGGGRTIFDGLYKPLKLDVVDQRSFRNGKQFLRYAVKH